APTHLDLFHDLLHVCEELGVRTSDVVTEHVVSLLQDVDLSPADLKRGLSQWTERMDVTTALSRVANCHQDLNVEDGYEKLAVYYEWLSGFIGQQDRTRANQLTSRVSVLALIQQESFRKAWDLSLREIIIANYSPDEDKVFAFYKSSWKPDSDVGSLKTLFDSLPSLLSLTFLQIFPEERGMSLDHSLLRHDIPAIMSRLCMEHVDAIMERIEWDYETEETIENDFKGMEMLLQYLLPGQIAKVVTFCCTGDQGVYAPVSMRLSFLAVALSILDNTLPEKVDWEASAKVSAVLQHVQFVESLGSLKDESTDAGLPFERIQQFDWTFDEGSSEALTLCMKMVIAGTTPNLVHQTASLLGTHFNDTEAFHTFKVYRDALSCVLGLPAASQYSTVFPKGVEAPVDALDRLLDAVANYVAVDGFEEDGWEEEGDWGNSGATNGGAGDNDLTFMSVSKLVSRLEATLKEAMIEVVEGDRSLIAADVRLGLLEMLKKHYGYETVDTSHLQFVKIDVIVRNSWGLEISESDLETESSADGWLQKLLENTKTPEQCQSCVEVLSILQTKFGSGSVLTGLWKQLINVCAQTQDFVTLIALRTKERQFGHQIFDDDIEANLLWQLTAKSDFNSSLAAGKISVMSRNADTAVSSHGLITDLIHDAFSSQATNTVLAVDALASDHLLHLLILANPELTAAVASTGLWSHVVNTLFSVGEIADVKLARKLSERWVKTVVLGLVSRSKYSAAAAVVVTATGTSKEVVRGLSSRLAILKGYLKILAAADIGHEEFVGADIVDWEVADEIREMRLSASNIDEQALTFEALKKVEGLIAGGKV
ncbi:hypothetical protein HDU76_004627, partial [Blyttiomyces sp. JEL0837]